MESLARELREVGSELLVAAPSQQDAAYTHDDLPVQRVDLAPSGRHLRELYGEGDALAARGFGPVLDEEDSDLAHLHAFTRGVSLLSMREAERRALARDLASGSTRSEVKAVHPPSPVGVSWP